MSLKWTQTISWTKFCWHVLQYFCTCSRVITRGTVMVKQKQLTAKKKKNRLNLICYSKLSYHITLEVDFHNPQSISLTSRYFSTLPTLPSFSFPMTKPLFCVWFRAGFGLKKPLKMNMVKRIMGRPRQEECSPQDNALGLMHLRRLFSELCHPPRHMTQKEQEEKLYMMLPVFNRVRERVGCVFKETALSANLHKKNHDLLYSKSTV